MCGIAGIISIHPIQPRVIYEMNDLLRHRGPDDEGYVLFDEDDCLCLGGPRTGEVVYNSNTPYRPLQSILSSGLPASRLALAHSRLSIHDLSPQGHQPMSYLNRYWLIFNGEIYNYIELRGELEAEGYHFISNTDTEVVLAAFDRWGEQCLSRFNGMWAIAIYDTSAQSLFLARDRFGVKPLCYWISDNGYLAFASEVKAFTVLPEWRAIANGQRVYDFLAWGILDHTDETMFEGVFQIRQGHMASISTGIQDLSTIVKKGGVRLTQSDWYRLPPVSAFSSGGCERFSELFADAVGLRLRADVPIGSCLSGGLDSSAIVCTANRMLREKGGADRQKTFSACSHVARFDERPHIEAVVAHTGVMPHYVYPHQDKLFEVLEDLVWHQDEPFGSTSIFAQWCVFEEAAKCGIKVMLDGQGADEQLGGYHTFLGPFLSGLIRSLSFQQLFGEWRAIRRHHGYSHVNLIKKTSMNLFPGLIKPIASLMDDVTAGKGWVDLELLGAIPLDPIKSVGGRSTTIRGYSQSQLNLTSLPMLLHWEDRDSMAHSIEARVPFLDYRLVEFVLGLPDTQKISDGITKRVLREAMRGVLPESVRMRMDKLGFVTPEETWIRRESTERFKSALREAVSVSRGVLTEKSLVIFDRMVDGTLPFNSYIWRLISFGAWVKRFNVEISSGQKGTSSGSI